MIVPPAGTLGIAEVLLFFMSIRIYLLLRFVAPTSAYLFYFQFMRRDYKKESDFLYSHIVMG